MSTNNSNSTIKNYHPIPFPLIWLGRLLQKVSKSLAAAYSRFFFMTPRRYHPPKVEQQWMALAKQWKMEIKGINKTVCIYRWGDPRARPILLVHGWSGRATQFVSMGKTLLDQGYQILAFDAPAHGCSPGRKTLMFDFIEIINTLANQFGPFHAIVGHSLGGIAALNAVGNFKVPTNYLVTIGIPDSIERIFYRFTRLLGLHDDIAQINIDYLERIYNVDIHHLSGSFIASRLQIPALIVHDYDDREVPYTEALSIANSSSHCQLLLTHGLGHRRILHDKEVIRQIIKFLENQNVDPNK